MNCTCVTVLKHHYTISSVIDVGSLEDGKSDGFKCFDHLYGWRDIYRISSMLKSISFFNYNPHMTACRHLYDIYNIGVNKTRLIYRYNIF